MKKRSKEKQEVSFDKDVTKESVAELKETLRQISATRKKIVLTISSQGGNPFAAFAFYDWVCMRKIALTTVALGNTNSAAIILFLVGEKRIAGKHAIFRFHEFSITFNKGATFNVSELTRQGRLYKKEQDIYIQIVSERCERTIDEVKAVMEGNVAMDAEEAKKFGLAHEIL